MKCPMESAEHTARLLDYAAGKLDSAATAMLEAHLANCPDCGALAERQRAVWQTLDVWEPAPVPMNFDRRLYQRIEQQVSWFDRLTASLFRHAVPVAATAGVVMMAGFLLQHPPAPPVPEQASVQVEALAPDQVQTALDDMEMLRDLNHLAAEPRM